MKLSEIVERYFSVRHCAGCGALLSYGEKDEAFCAECREKFWRSLVSDCPVCGKPSCECRCLPPLLAKAGAKSLFSLTAYENGGDFLPLRNAVVRLKDLRVPRVEKYLALRLAPPILKETAEKGIDRRDLTVTYLPRSKKAVATSGVDQAKNVAAALAHALGVPLSTLLERASDGGSQKARTAAERASAAASFYRLRGTADLTGKTVILVDDVVTTGASLAAGVRLLRKRGAEVYPAVLAVTRRKKPKKAVQRPTARARYRYGSRRGSGRSVRPIR